MLISFPGDFFLHTKTMLCSEQLLIFITRSFLDGTAYVPSAKLRWTQRPGFAIKGEAGQVQGEPCRGSRGAEPLAGRDGAKTCALVKKRAGAAEKVPQNRPNISE